MRLPWIAVWVVFTLPVFSLRAAEPEWLEGRFAWTSSGPLVMPADRPEDPCDSIKDPTVVYHNGQWHLFCTIRSQKRSHQIEYLAFADWKDANVAKRHILAMTDGYFCAPQVFYFTPHRKWYMIYQATDPSRKPALQPVFSTSDDVAKPASWSKPVLLFQSNPQIRSWIDFWVICDDARAFLFFTSNDGLMWRSETKLGDFPHGWSQPVVCLRGDIFEASHTYALKGLGRYLTLVEARGGTRRYYKAYLADALDGEWKELAGTVEKPFAGVANVKLPALRWTDSYSHGELLRIGCDQRLEVDPMRLRFLYQGVRDQDMRGKAYGKIPWQLGILEQVK